MVRKSSLHFASPGKPFLCKDISFDSKSCEEQDGVYRLIMGATMTKLLPNLQCNGDEKDKGRFLLYL